MSMMASSSFPPPTKLWVQLNSGHPVRVSTEGCEIVDDFIKAIKKELELPHPPQVISLSLTCDGPPLEQDAALPASNTAKTPLFVTTAYSGKPISMSFSKAEMPFIRLATEIKGGPQPWKNIPVDEGVVPPDLEAFVKSFRTFCAGFDMGTEAGRRLVINLVLEPGYSLVSEFQDLFGIPHVHGKQIQRAKIEWDIGLCDLSS